MILKPCPVSTDRFNYIASDNTFVADASDLNGFGRVYDDACDLGVTLVSAKTGREVVFVVTAERRDGEGEILFWELRPATLDTRRSPGTVQIYND